VVPDAAWPAGLDALDPTTVAVGVDVSEARGLDVVVLDPRRVVVGAWRRQAPADLERVLRELGPAVVAIDSPPAWGTTGACRPAERAIRRLGMGIFATPSDPAAFDHPFYRWMVAGFAAFEAAAAAAGFVYHRGRGPVAGRALEVFPHATALRLGGDPTLGPKRVWRSAVLEAVGVDCSRLRSMDAIDAALAAFTGLLALDGRCEALGDETDGVIVIPRPIG
jgi:predicted nuclease with RNAse H fold